MKYQVGQKVMINVDKLDANPILNSRENDPTWSQVMGIVRDRVYIIEDTHNRSGIKAYKMKELSSATYLFEEELIPVDTLVRPSENFFA